jgi:hypothetical protein
MSKYDGRDFASFMRRFVDFRCIDNKNLSRYISPRHIGRGAAHGGIAKRLRSNKS